MKLDKIVTICFLQGVILFIFIIVFLQEINFINIILSLAFAFGIGWGIGASSMYYIIRRGIKKDWDIDFIDDKPKIKIIGRKP